VRALGALDRIDATEVAFWDSLADNLNTPAALQAAAALAARVSGLVAAAGEGVAPLAHARAAHTLGRALGTLGLSYPGMAPAPALSINATTPRDVPTTASTERPAPEDVVAALVGFRAEVAMLARGNDAALASRVLQVCDQLRDRVLPALSVRVQVRIPLAQVAP
jgi:cysteinyl-tRNA synthetase